MACDFSIAADLARFGQAGPKHGSAPDGGSTDFLHLFVGIGRAIESCTLCELWSAPRAVWMGLPRFLGLFWMPSLRKLM